MTADSVTRARVLVIDNDRLSRELTVSILEQIGVVTMDQVDDTDEALALLRQFRFDLIVSDLMMEPTDGIEFTRRLRTRPDSPNPTVPVVLVTAHADRTTVLEARDAGVNALVTKPVSIDEMRRKITHALNDPRQFIRSDEYVGPDRRHRNVPLAGRRDRRKPR